MKKLEKKIFGVAIIFIIIYLGAIIVSINSKPDKNSTDLKIESVQIKSGEETFVLAELFLPMVIIAVMALSFILIRKKNTRTIKMLDKEEEADQTDDTTP